MPISCVPDHVAAAVTDLSAAHARWGEQLGGGTHGGGANTPGFRNHQYVFRGGAVLELVAPGTDEGGGFTGRFLDRFGPRVHHVTLKVEDLPAALEVLEAAGLEVVDVDLSDERWREAFVRPSVVGGLIVQVASTTMTAEDWTELVGIEQTPPADDGARLVGPLLQHPDLERARFVWSTLGGTVADLDDETLEVTWPDAPLTVRIRRGEAAGPVGLRFADTPPLPADPQLGPAVLPA